MHLPLPLFVASLSLALLAPGANAAPGDGVVRIDIDGVRNTRGDVACLLFNQADGYPEDHAKAYREKHAAIDQNRAVCEFKDLAPGTYAAIVFHDENLSGKLDKNLFGMPQEGYGASNNVRPRFSAPGFQPASFAVTAGGVTPLTIQLGY
jgi:uncharacterized protein (DUF2141 family)